MRWLLFLLSGLAALAAAQEPSSLDDARVQIPYKELRSLLDAARAKPQEVSPVASAILSARFGLHLGDTGAAGQADFEVQTFRDGPHVVPLVGDALIIESIEPKDTVVVVRDGHYAIVLEGRQRAKATLRFTLPVKKSDDGLVAECAINPAVSTSVEVRDVPKGRHVVVDNALKNPSDERKWQLGRSALLRIALRDEPRPLPPPLTLPAVIREASSEMRVVRDGAFSNKMSWRIRHQSPLVWKLDVPESLQLVSARIGGRPTSPSRIDAKTLEFRLPEPANGDETLVELSYTGKGTAFDPVRGELALALPSTPLLIENLQWRVAIPAAYETVAAQGNVEFLPARSPEEILLGKELCQGEAPAVRIFYQKPETTKKP